MIDTKKLLDWLGVTMFEIFLFSGFLLISIILLSCKLDGVLQLSWFNVFLPLYINDALAAYFCMIIFIRQYINGYVKQAFYRAIYSFFQLFLVCSLKVCLMFKLDGKKIDNSDILLQLGILQAALLTRLCIKH